MVLFSTEEESGGKCLQVGDELEGIMSEEFRLSKIALWNSFGVTDLHLIQVVGASVGDPRIMFIDFINQLEYINSYQLIVPIQKHHYLTVPT